MLTTAVPDSPGPAVAAGRGDTVDFLTAAVRRADTPVRHVPASGWSDPLLDRLVTVALELVPASEDGIAEPTRRALTVRLGDQLAAIAARTVIRELHRGAAPGRACDSERVQRFRAELASVAGRERFVARYPELARLLATVAANAGIAAAELVRRFAADRPMSAPPAAVHLGAGDTHHGGRGVAIVTAADGTGVVYKPRPQRLGVLVGELIERYGRALGDPLLRGPRTDDRGAYGWCELVRPADCAGPDAVAAFYRRQGALLALLHAIGMTDVHEENLIAAGDVPVMIDVETAWHPQRRMPTAVDDPALVALLESVARSGMLPVVAHTAAGMSDRSALGGGIEQRTDLDIAQVLDAGTDGMRLVRRPFPVSPTACRPRLHGAPVAPDEHLDDVLSGFEHGHRLLSANPSILAGPDGTAVRYLARETRLYSLLLAESTHPDLTTSAARRAGFLRSQLLARSDAATRGLVEFEVRDLLDGDVPLFTVPADGTEVHHDAEHTGVHVEHCPATTARQQVAGLDDADRRRQLWVIAASFATRTAAVDHTAESPVPTARRPRTGFDRDRCLQRVLAIAGGLADAAITGDDGRPNWLGLDLADGEHWTLTPLGAGLGDGFPGVAVLFADLARVTGSARHADTARRIAAPLQRLTDWLAGQDDAALVLGGGAATGLGGLLYAAHRLEPVMPELAATTATLLRIAGVLADPAIAETGDAAAGDADAGDAALDTGRAGLLAALVARLAVAPDDAGAEVRAAAALADSLALGLCEHPGPHSGSGLRSGRDGVVWALGRYARLRTAGGEPQHAARAAATAHRLLGGPPEVAGLGLCRGESGAALAAAAAGDTLTARRHLDLVLGADAAPADDSICHGAAGVLECLGGLAELGYGQAARHRLVRATALLDDLDDRAPRCATPRAIPTPGLLTGLAGIAHALLRVADPGVPSAVLLDPVTRPDRV